MRLFKYMSLDSLRAVLEHNTLGFSRPAELNDPFDWPTAPDTCDYGLFGGINARLKGEIWAEHMGVCSLTRTPTNSLMWAHYGDKHRGAVIEIDAGAAGFLETETNAVPAHFGSVIYLNQPNMDQYAGDFAASPPVTIGQLFAFRLDYYQQLQRLFLSKPLCWAYEEEVRVVKCLRGVEGNKSENASGRFSTITRPDGSAMQVFHLPADAVTGIYFGIGAKAAEVRSIVRDFGIEGSRIGRKHRGSYDVQFAQLSRVRAGGSSF